MKSSLQDAQRVTSLVDAATDIDPSTRKLWKYQYLLGREIIIPFLREHGLFKKGQAICEVGCAEGGVLAALVECGASRALGTDIDTVRLNNAEALASLTQLPAQFQYNDIVSEPVEGQNSSFDLVMLRDVIEHLDDAQAALKNISHMLKPGGLVYVNFPPFRSPFGGHQHTLNTTIGKLPWIHLLPKPVFTSLTKGGRAPDVIETQRLQNIRFSTAKMHKAVELSGLSVLWEGYFLLRPVYRFRLGLPFSMSFHALRYLPFFRDFFAMEAAFILQKAQ